MNQQENDNPTVLDDLPVDEARQDEAKGGGISRFGIVVDDDYPGNPPGNTGTPGVGVLKSSDGGRTW